MRHIASMGQCKDTVCVYVCVCVCVCVPLQMNSFTPSYLKPITAQLIYLLGGSAQDVTYYFASQSTMALNRYQQLQGAYTSTLHAIHAVHASALRYQDTLGSHNTNVAALTAYTQNTRDTINQSSPLA